jgi:hypothetical protein
MSTLSPTGREVVKGTRILMGHLAATLLGLLFMIIGSAMGVSLVLLPIGIPLGLAGLALVLSGCFGWACREEESTGSYKVDDPSSSSLPPNQCGKSALGARIRPSRT